MPKFAKQNSKHGGSAIQNPSFMYFTAMRIFVHIIEFFSNGSRVLRVAAKGQYDNESAAVANLKEEMFSLPANDRQRLRQDLMSVGRDWRIAADKVILENG